MNANIIKIAAAGCAAVAGVLAYGVGSQEQGGVVGRVDVVAQAPTRSARPAMVRMERALLAADQGVETLALEVMPVADERFAKSTYSNPNRIGAPPFAGGGFSQTDPRQIPEPADDEDENTSSHSGFGLVDEGGGGEDEGSSSNDDPVEIGDEDDGGGSGSGLAMSQADAVEVDDDTGGGESSHDLAGAVEIEEDDDGGEDESSSSNDDLVELPDDEGDDGNDDSGSWQDEAVGLDDVDDGDEGNDQYETDPLEEGESFPPPHSGMFGAGPVLLGDSDDDDDSSQSAADADELSGGRNASTKADPVQIPQPQGSGSFSNQGATEIGDEPPRPGGSGLSLDDVTEIEDDEEDPGNEGSSGSSFTDPSEIPDDSGGDSGLSEDDHVGLPDEVSNDPTEDDEEELAGGREASVRARPMGRPASILGSPSFGDDPSEIPDDSGEEGSAGSWGTDPVALDEDDDGGDEEESSSKVDPSALPDDTEGGSDDPQSVDPEELPAEADEGGDEGEAVERRGTRVEPFLPPNPPGDEEGESEVAQVFVEMTQVEREDGGSDEVATIMIFARPGTGYALAELDDAEEEGDEGSGGMLTFGEVGMENVAGPIILLPEDEQKPYTVRLILVQDGHAYQAPIRLR